MDRTREALAQMARREPGLAARLTAQTLRSKLRSRARVDPDLLYRALPYMVDPEWTRGHRGVVRYEIDGRRWDVEVRDGEPLRVTALAGDAATNGDSPDHANAGEAHPDAIARISGDTFRRLLARELSPTDAMRLQLTEIEGAIPLVTLLGRWMDRSQGRDEAELEREQRQRELQERRGGRFNGASGGELLGYEQLYALWEKQNWKAHELDFSVDQQQWLTTPTESQQHTAWSLGSFYIGEERVTADLAPFLLAAPSGEVELFLATQLVDEARHAAFFDRFGAEVMALTGEDLRGRLRELEQMMEPAWHDTFDAGLREVANRIKARPDDLDLFVEGIVTYHLVIEGVLAMTGQRLILQYLEDHSLYPGFCQGFGLVERDEHRHIAFGVRFLQEMMSRDPKRYGDLIQRRVLELVPGAVRVFVPPYADSAESFVSYGYDSAQIYGYAFRALKRRLAVIGLDCPPAEELMPGPIAEGDAVLPPASAEAEQAAGATA